MLEIPRPREHVGTEFGDLLPALRLRFLGRSHGSGVFDYQQILPEPIVKFTGNSGTLLLLYRDQLAGKSASFSRARRCARNRQNKKTKSRHPLTTTTSQTERDADSANRLAKEMNTTRTIQNTHPKIKTMRQHILS